MNPKNAIRLIQTLGPSTTLKRVINMVKVKSGYLERIDPAAAFGVEQLNACLRDTTTDSLLSNYHQQRPPFFFDFKDDARRSGVRQVFNDERRAALLTRVQKIERGIIRHYSATDFEMGRPIRWHWAPQADIEWPVDRHWCRYGQFAAGLGDVKNVWETNRFAFAFDLVRAAVVFDDDRWLGVGLDLIDEWIDANPPGFGPQWNCGQECALRLMAWHFVIRAAVDRDLLDAPRMARIAASIYRQTLRIDHYISFARSIRNNHSMSEAIGLYTTGVLYPWFDKSPRWRQLGIDILAKEVDYQCFDDGTYIQHSFNYQRLAASLALWVSRLAALNNDALPARTTTAFQRHIDCLIEMVEPTSGRVPNYGPNDGALILPLAECDYLDYRPVVQAGARMTGAPDLFEPGPWDELSCWLGYESDGAPDDRLKRRTSQSYPVGGYFTLRDGDAFGLTRCHTYFERPHEADMLHLDLWYRGQNVLRDAGSYSYNSDEPWLSYFKSTAAHNTIEIESASQMVKGPRFMWYEWTRSEFIGRGELDDGAGEWWEGRHFGYQSRFGVVQTRRIERRGSDDWRVIDTLTGNGETRGTVRWRLLDCPVELDEEKRMVRATVQEATMSIAVEAGEALQSIDVVRGLDDGGAVDGWESLYYGCKSPLPVLRVSFAGKMPMTIETQIRFNAET